MSFLGGGSRSSGPNTIDDGSPAASSTPPLVSQLQLQGDPAASQDSTTSHSSPSAPPPMARRASVDQSESIQRKPSRTLLRRRSSASNTNTGTLFRKRSTSGISNKDFPPVGSDTDAGSHTPSYRSPSPTKMFSPRFLPNTNGSSASASATADLSISSPPGSPTKRSRALFPTRGRKDSAASISSAGISGGPSAPNPMSRPTSPMKDLFGGSSSSAGAARKGGIDKSLIGLPTNFKHTGGGGTSSPSLETAIALPGLEAHLPPSSPHMRDRKISAPSSPGSRQQPRLAGPGGNHDTSLQDSLAQINSAMGTSSPDQAAPSADMWQPRDARLDTVKEVPSGFIQRFEKMGQAPGPQGEGLGGLGRGGTRADARELFGGSASATGLPDGSGQPFRSPSPTGRIASQPPLRSTSPLRSVSPPSRAAGGNRPWPARPSSPPVSPSAAASASMDKSLFTEVGISNEPSSPIMRATSPTRMGRRKPVPSLDSTSSPTTAGAREQGAMRSSPPSRQAQSPSPSPLRRPASPPVPASKPQPPRPSSPSQQQDWAATLAEISDALNAPLPSATKSSK